MGIIILCKNGVTPLKSNEKIIAIFGKGIMGKRMEYTCVCGLK